MSESPRDFEEAFKYAQTQWHGGPHWKGMCQKFVRSCYGIGGGFGSAYAQWLGMPKHAKHAGGNPDNAPLGAALFYKGRGKYGHVMLAKRPFHNGVSAAWSNDLVRVGYIDAASRHAPISQWGEAYLGYGTNLNGVDLDLTHGTPKAQKKTAPKEKPYKNIADAIDQLEHALVTAKHYKDPGTSRSSKTRSRV